ncbi:MAG: pilus (MSHA type) biogenesis protein MshL [Gammaproteobacteria bacterium]|nr:pilus (MSHA type) biogenesis protein MshL [Gammaproteobacteria bacterium]
MSPGSLRQKARIDRDAMGNRHERRGAFYPAFLLPLLLGACANTQTVDLSSGHLLHELPPAAQEAPIVVDVPPAPEPEKLPAVETYTVVVKELPVVDLLFSLARDAGLDIDLQASADKTVTLNAVNRPLQEILSRIAEQAQLRYQLRGSNLIVQDDLPYWHNYLVDYVNIARSSVGEVGVATQIATSGGSVGEQSGQRGDGQGNTSKTTVKSNSENDFWAALEEGLTSIIGAIRDPAATFPQDNDPVITNPMSSVVTVFGTQKAHARVQRYLDRIMMNSQRQVLIEMTIVEVELSDNFQAGVDWQKISESASGNNDFSVQTDLLGGDLNLAPFVSLSFDDIDVFGSNIAAAVRMLQQFGDTKVLSSPKIMALNNQTALLKVVNEKVFFTVELDVREATADIPERRTFTSELHTVPVGLVMSVTPQISEGGFVSINIRPTISRITGFAVDPAPRLAGADFDNLIPEIQVREIESLLQVMDGRTVVLGGLMQNEQVSAKDGVPGLSRIPGVGRLFSYTRDNLIKTELVIFLKPTIIRNGTPPAGSPEIGDYYEIPVGPQAISQTDYR